MHEKDRGLCRNSYKRSAEEYKKRNEYTIDYQITQIYFNFLTIQTNAKTRTYTKAYNHLEHANIFMHNALRIRYVCMFKYKFIAITEIVEEGVRLIYA